MKTACTGFTLIEAMITVAILAIVAAVAIPAYNGYIAQTHFNTARANMESLRLALEDFALDNNTYKAGNSTSLTWTSGGTPTNCGGIQINGTPNAGMTALGWCPAGDLSKYNYNVVAANTNYSIITTDSDGYWVRCDNKMQKCCNSSNASSSTTACP